jgi:methyltransferase
VLTRMLVCTYMGLARLAELALSSRNLAQEDLAAESGMSRATYPFIIGVHTLAIAGTLLFGYQRSRSWLLLLLAVQPLRAWVLLTLGRRWNARGAVSALTEVETGGPYAFVRHPNYAVVIVELLALPMAFRARKLALIVTVLNAALLTVRVHAEEEALMQLPGYARHFANKKRFIPRLF